MGANACTCAHMRSDAHACRMSRRLAGSANTHTGTCRHLHRHGHRPRRSKGTHTRWLLLEQLRVIVCCCTQQRAQLAAALGVQVWASLLSRVNSAKPVLQVGLGQDIAGKWHKLGWLQGQARRGRKPFGTRGGQGHPAWASWKHATGDAVGLPPATRLESPGQQTSSRGSAELPKAAASGHRKALRREARLMKGIPYPGDAALPAMRSNSPM